MITDALSPMQCTEFDETLKTQAVRRLLESTLHQMESGLERTARVVVEKVARQLRPPAELGQRAPRLEADLRVA